jgi:predicted nuclease of predicted toxin-antitoxin system
MRFYLDEDMASGLLAALLEKAGHDVVTPLIAGLIGRSDAIQLTFAIADKRICLSQNYRDFEELHLLLSQASGRHFGIFVVRRENDPSRDMSEKGIVTAIRKLEAAGVRVENEYVVLNHWR